MRYLILAAIKLKWAVALASLILLSILLPRMLVDPTATSYTLRVPLDSAAGLYAGSDVEIAGAKAGRIDALGLQDGIAIASIRIDPQYAPVHSDATVTLRPKSLLGEKYLALDPGKAPSTLSSNAQLPRTHVAAAVELQDVFNTFDQPTRDKLQVAIDELGGGLAGEGMVQNRGLSAGSQDLTDLAAVADQLAQRDHELRDVIGALSQVTSELAQSDRRTQLGQLIKNTEALMKTLADQDAQIQRALGETNAALSRTDAALQGTGGNLNNINHSLATTVHAADQVTGDLSSGMNVLMPRLDEFITGIQEGPQVFGGYDQNGYATRISLIGGTGTVGLPSPDVPAGQRGSASTPAGQPPAIVPGSNDNLGGVLGFILATPAPASQQGPQP
jgi:phospholipid/cholesterol/gamma-HCH transport system substrate-binding protein